jgi:hypothetical protein
MSVTGLVRPEAEPADEVSMWEDHPDANEVDPTRPAARELLPWR